MEKSTITTKIKESRMSALLKTILQEIRSMRKEMILFFPEDNLNEYIHPKRIKQSYRKAIKKYPPLLS